MGVIFSTLRNLWLDLKWYFKFTRRGNLEVSYMRPFTIDGFGWYRENLRNDWYLTTTSMMESGVSNKASEPKLIKNMRDVTKVPTRNIIFDIVKYHCNLEIGKMKRFQWDDEHLKYVFTEWNEEKVFEIWDMFLALETIGDHTEMRISYPALFTSLDNLNNHTGNLERMDYLCYGIPPKQFLKEAITFEEFLYILYDLLVLQNGKHQLAKTFQDILNDIKLIRAMGLYQQLESGFF